MHKPILDTSVLLQVSIRKETNRRTILRCKSYYCMNILFITQYDALLTNNLLFDFSEKINLQLFMLVNYFNGAHAEMRYVTSRMQPPKKWSKLLA